MASFRIVCVGCARPFTAKSARAKWCGRTCQQRNRRAERRAAEVAVVQATRVSPHPLVTKTQEELEAAGVADTVDGLLAIHLATVISVASGDGKTGPVREYRTARAAALGLDATADTSEDAADTSENGENGEHTPTGEDELDAIRRRRDEKRELARRGAG